MPTAHLSALGLDVQRVVTPLKAVTTDVDWIRLVHDGASPEQGRDPNDCVPDTSRASAHVVKAVTERLTDRNVVGETRLPFAASFEELYVVTTDLLRGAATDGGVQANLAGTPPQVAAAFYTARTALVDGSEPDRGTVSFLTTPMIDHSDLAAIDDLWSPVGDVEVVSDTFDEFRRVSDGPTVTAVACPLRIALPDLRDALADVSGESCPNSCIGRTMGARGVHSDGDSPLGVVSSYVGRVRGQLVDLVESENPRPDPENTHDPNAILDAFDVWLDGESRLLVSAGGNPHELVARSRTGCGARFGRFEDRATAELSKSPGRFEAHLDAYLDAHS